MAISFPVGPTNGQVYIASNGISYSYNSSNTSWVPGFARSSAVRQIFTATASQTSFTITGGYAPGLIDVYKNGIKLNPNSAVTITSGTVVVLSSGATAGDYIEVDGLSQFALANMFKKTGDTLTGPLILSTYTVAGLPAGTIGALAFATNGRKSSEGAGAGTGVTVCYSNGNWRRLSDETVVAA